MKFSIGTRLIISFLSIIIVSLLVSINTFYLLNNSRSESMKIISDSNIVTLKANKLRYAMLQMSDGLRGLLLEHENTVEKQRKLSADADFVSTTKDIKELTTNNKIIELVNKIADIDATQLNASEDEIMELVKTDVEKAQKLYWSKYVPIRSQQTKLIDDLDASVIKNQETLLAQTQENHNRVLNIAYSLLLILFLIGLGLVFYIIKSISAPIAKVIKDADYILKESLNGNLSVRVNKETHTGDFRKIIEGINDILDAVVEPIKEGSEVLKYMSAGNFSVAMEGSYKGDHAILKDSLNNTLQSINELISHVNITVEQVASGSEQVSSAAQSLSECATEQAASLEEITSSMQEIGSQTTQNAENANKANQLASLSINATEKGNTQMSDLLLSMKEINESSKSISKIIKVIDEIAFQTNLLALNAAVEAARAGKHGKGFAVVAEEVRNLAARSATAAKETAELIEGAIKKAENGASITSKTTEVLKEIELTSTKVGDIIAEIAAASNEQAQGISQVNTGLTQIEQVTHQNTASSEECASTSSELYSQSEELRLLLGKFKLSDKYQKMSFEKTRYKAKSSNKNALVKSFSQIPANYNPRDVISLDDSDFGKY